MKYTLTAPITVGSFENPITVDKLELASVSLNFEPSYTDSGASVLAVVLVHRASGYKVNIVYEDASALEFWHSHEGTLGPAVLTKLVADGKLPSGTLSE